VAKYRIAEAKLKDYGLHEVAKKHGLKIAKTQLWGDMQGDNLFV
jgi:hypothetical protein